MSHITMFTLGVDHWKVLAAQIHDVTVDSPALYTVAHSNPLLRWPEVATSGHLGRQLTVAFKKARPFDLTILYIDKALTSLHKVCQFPIARERTGPRFLSVYQRQTPNQSRSSGIAMCYFLQHTQHHPKMMNFTGEV